MMRAPGRANAAYPPPGMVGPQLIARWALGTMTNGVHVDGLEHIPPGGPVMLVARHFHHLLDGAVLVRYVGRPVHIVVGLDWASGSAQRRWMERACRWARYPVVLRRQTTGTRGGYAARDVTRYIRSGLSDAAALLRDGRVVVVFPEGYPVVDPAVSSATPHVRDRDGFLPFARGFRGIARIARRNGAPDIAVIPVGFRYERRGTKWAISARIGAALDADDDVPALERAIRTLSR